MAPQELIAKFPPIRQPADFKRMPLLRTPLESWRPWFRAAGLDWPEPARGPKLVDLGLAIEAAVSGQGIGLLRPSLASYWMALGKLRPVSSVVVEPPNQYYLLPFVSGGPAAAFSQWLLETCRDVSQQSNRDLASLFSIAV